MIPMLAIEDEWIPILAISGGLGLAIIGMVTGAIRRSLREKYREESRREIAAYVAEGSITAADGERLLKAGRKKEDAEA